MSHRLPIYRYVVLLCVSWLAACAPQPPATERSAEEAGTAEATLASPPEPKPELKPEPNQASELPPDQSDTVYVKPPLDLSMPENFFADEPLTLGAGPTAGFDAGALFDKKGDNSLNVKVLPNIKEGESPEDLPQLDWGTVTVEKKTR